MVDKNDLKDAAEAVQDADAAVAEAVLPVRGAAPVRLLSLLSEIGDQPQLRTLSGTLIAVGLMRRDARMARAGAKMLVAHELATAIKNFVKRRIDRTRPRSLGEARDAHKMRPGDNHSKEETSFPSGHSAGAAAVAAAFAQEYPEYRGAAIAAGAGVAVAQIPRCAHYPTDVGAGLAIGLASAAMVGAASARLEPALAEA